MRSCVHCVNKQGERRSSKGMPDDAHAHAAQADAARRTPGKPASARRAWHKTLVPAARVVRRTWWSARDGWGDARHMNTMKRKSNHADGTTCLRMDSCTVAPAIVQVYQSEVHGTHAPCTCSGLRGTHRHKSRAGAELLRLHCWPLRGHALLQLLHLWLLRRRRRARLRTVRSHVLALLKALLSRCLLRALAACWAWRLRILACILLLARGWPRSIHSLLWPVPIAVWPWAGAVGLPACVWLALRHTILILPRRVCPARSAAALQRRHLWHRQATPSIYGRQPPSTGMPRFSHVPGRHMISKSELAERQKTRER